MSTAWPPRILTITLGRIADVQLGKMLQPAPSSVDDGEVRYLRAGSLSNLGNLDELPVMYASPQEVLRYAVCSGDLVVAEGGDAGRSEFLPELPSGIIIQNSLHRVRARRTLADIRYIKYCLDSLYASGWLDVVCNRATFGHLTKEKLTSLPVPHRPASDQRSIADYLDSETARLSALVSAEQMRLALAVERRTAAIQPLVLGRASALDGGDTSAGPLAPIPDHWIWRQNKTLLREVVALSEFGEEELLTVSHITGVTPRSEKDVTMFLAESNEGYKRVRRGDLVINTMWAWMGALGVSPCDGIVSPAYGVYRFEEGAVDEEYFNALYRSPAYVTEMTRYSRGVWTSRLRLYPEVFLSLRTPLPPLPEQRRIAAQVRELNAETARLVDLLKRSIDLLLERRQALITAAVTGELEVPEVAA